MITTFPGLYGVVALLAEITSFIFRVSSVDICANIWLLRIVNVMFLAATRVVLDDIMQQLALSKDSTRMFWRASSLCLFPLHWFFQLIFYTDSGSTFFVLWCYSLCLSRRFFGSGLVGVAAVLFRQTNVVWVAFVACVALLRDFETVVPSSRGTLDHLAHVLVCR
jgi:alpha-1,2-glucosyltransferase